MQFEWEGGIVRPGSSQVAHQPDVQSCHIAGKRRRRLHPQEVRVGELPTTLHGGLRVLIVTEASADKDKVPGRVRTRKPFDQTEVDFPVQRADIADPWSRNFRDIVRRSLQRARCKCLCVDPIRNAENRRLGLRLESRLDRVRDGNHHVASAKQSLLAVDLILGPARSRREEIERGVDDQVGMYSDRVIGVVGVRYIRNQSFAGKRS